MTMEAMLYISIHVANLIILAYAAAVLAMYGRAVLPSVFEAIAALYAVQAILTAVHILQFEVMTFVPGVDYWAEMLYHFSIPLIVSKIIMSSDHGRTRLHA